MRPRLQPWCNDHGCFHLNPQPPATPSGLACCTSFQLQRTRMGVDRRRGAATRFTLSLARRLISGIEPSPPPSIMNIPCQCIGRRRDVYIREAEDLDRTAVFILARGRPWLDDMPPRPPGTSYPGAVCQIPFWSSTGSAYLGGWSLRHGVHFFLLFPFRRFYGWSTTAQLI